MLNIIMIIGGGLLVLAGAGIVDKARNGGEQLVTGVVALTIGVALILGGVL